MFNAPIQVAHVVDTGNGIAATFAEEKINSGHQCRVQNILADLKWSSFDSGKAQRIDTRALEGAEIQQSHALPLCGLHGPGLAFPPHLAARRFHNLKHVSRATACQGKLGGIWQVSDVIVSNAPGSHGHPRK
jgi:hypothetical protein